MKTSRLTGKIFPESLRAGWILVLTAFFLAWAFLRLTWRPEDPPKGADATSWFAPALNLAHGDFLENPENFFRGPLLPAFGVAAFKMFGQETPYAVILLQIGVFLGTLLATVAIARALEAPMPWLAGWLLLLNPNSFSTVFLNQSETVFAAITAAVALLLLKQLKSPAWGTALLLGFVLGLSCLGRPNYVLFLLGYPWLLFLLSVGSGSRAILLIRNLTGSLVGLALCGLWMSGSYLLGQGFHLTPRSAFAVYINDMAYLAESLEKKSSLSANPEGHRSAVWKKLEEQIGDDWHDLTEKEKNDAKVQLGWARLGQVSPRTLAVAQAKAFAQFWFNAGSGNFYELLRWDRVNLTRWWIQYDRRSLQPVLDLLCSLPREYFAVMAACFFYVFLGRMLMVWGFLRLIRAGQIRELVLLGCLLLYLSNIQFLSGSSRRRVPVEPVVAALMALPLGRRKCRPTRP